MCGGVAAAVTLGMPGDQQSRRWPYLFCYNAGRLFSYMVAGAIIGGAFAGMANYSGYTSSLVALRLVAAFMMILLALYIGQWWQGVSRIERLGQGLWRQLAPKAQSLLPLKSPFAALPFGALWGWLPCGLVYSTLSWAAVSGGAFSGASVMFAFGLGTLPAMIAVGGMAQQLQKWLKTTTSNVRAPCCYWLMGSYWLYRNQTNNVVIFNTRHNDSYYVKILTYIKLVRQAYDFRQTYNQTYPIWRVCDPLSGLQYQSVVYSIYVK
ncbi:heavy-metal-associated domain (N-terminus) and membrane-bounded cytochrome biogenesis CcycZ-like domainprotein [Photobacterium aphoticum]|uniref:Heavy-metal-associated domain (N-terminus) and membrane-bounded cytochrome biogenesis CcycZ-like domainprotein n=1 Tax=Photobacterium aphoticum TaxID=754436 RepID=A0A090QP60_9GAMM|nr:heavy-metal-associated domain (N-terminus) and membrane-bounded cytochrome biogenesis CcycZ-like domainprotein [Photobacterium aphoticum]